MPSPYTSNYGRVHVTGATVTLTEAAHNGKIIAIDRAAGCVVTLPEATGSGARFHIYVKTSISSNALDIRTSPDTDLFEGAVAIAVAAGSAMFAADETDDNEISMNGSTSGGLVGSYLTLADLEDGKWSVTGVLMGSGTEITPFGAVA